MDGSNPSNRRRRLGEILLGANLIDDVQLKSALSEQRKWGGRLGRTLVEMGFVDEDSMVTALSRQLGLPAIDLDATNLSPEVGKLLRLDIAERYGVFPISADPRTKTLVIASSDPTNYEALQELAFRTAQKIQVQVAGARAIDRAIRRYYYGERTTPAATTTPQALGVEEATFDLQPSRGALASATSNGDLANRVAEMSQTLVHLEGLVAAQVQAIRGMLELLVEKGLLTREEYLERVRSGRP